MKYTAIPTPIRRPCRGPHRQVHGDARGANVARCSTVPPVRHGQSLAGATPHLPAHVKRAVLWDFSCPLLSLLLVGLATLPKSGTWCEAGKQGSSPVGKRPLANEVLLATDDCYELQRPGHQGRGGVAAAQLDPAQVLRL